MLKATSWVGILALLAGCGDAGNVDVGEGGAPPAGDGGGGAGDGGGDGQDSGTLPGDVALAQGVSIAQVAVYQTLKVPLMNGGTPASSAIPLVAGKEALLRVFFHLDAGWTPHNITGVLDVTAGGTTTTLMDVAGPTADTTEDAPLTGFSFHLTPAMVTTDATYSVRVVDPAKKGPKPSGAVPQRWPQDGSATSLGAKSAGSKLKIVIVPMAYNYDGSGRLPDTSQAQVNRLSSVMYALYPVPAIDMTVRSAIGFSGAISANGAGWGTALQTIASLRQNDGAAADQYYVGMFEPASSFGAFCGGGCVAGLSMLAQQPSDSYSRVSVALGYTGDEFGYTMAHEVGHAHGRSHAPCGGAQGVDPSFPYSNGGIGVYGYQLVQKFIISPTANPAPKDLMGYCSPDWISDYTYEALFTRIKYVNGALIKPGPARGYRWATVDGETLTYGPRFTGTLPPGGEPKTVGGATGWYYPFDHVPGGMLLVPDP